MNNFSVNFLPYKDSMPVYYGTYDSPYGGVVLLTTAEGICGLHFLEEPLSYYLSLAEKKFGLVPVDAPERTQAWWQEIQQAATPLPLVVQGTSFQISVWEALCAIPAGTTYSYQDIASQLGRAQAARAVGNAVGDNFIAWLIPCHRVVRQDGQMGKYRWGMARKVALLAAETCSK